MGALRVYKSNADRIGCVLTDEIQGEPVRRAGFAEHAQIRTDDATCQVEYSIVQGPKGWQAQEVTGPGGTLSFPAPSYGIRIG